MALIKCEECGKELSDKASACPNCGCPVTHRAQETQEPGWTQSNSIVPPPKKKRGCCSTPILIVFILFCVGMFIAVRETGKDLKSGVENTEQPVTKSEIVGKYLEDITNDEALKIDSILNECGITKLSSIEQDELLNDVHSEGEKGYRMETSRVKHIVMYLNSDKSVYSITYDTYPLYADEAVIASLQDYTFTIDEQTNLQLTCEQKVKEILKSPSTAKFPSILEWGFKKEKNISTVWGYVDSQNSFGAELRSEFQFVIDTDTSTMQSFVFDGEELIK